MATVEIRWFRDFVFSTRDVTGASSTRYGFHRRILGRSDGSERTQHGACAAELEHRLAVDRKPPCPGAVLSCSPDWARTSDIRLNRAALCQLSYQGSASVRWRLTSRAGGRWPLCVAGVPSGQSSEYSRSSRCSSSSCPTSTEEGGACGSLPAPKPAFTGGWGTRSHREGAAHVSLSSHQGRPAVRRGLAERTYTTPRSPSGHPCLPYHPPTLGGSS